MGDLAEIRCRFPAAPDWVWMRWHWADQAIFHEGLTLQQVAQREAASLACLATPYSKSEGGPVLGADYAGAWVQYLAEAGVMAVSPAFMADWAGWDASRPESAVQACSFVVVPPAVGWRDAPDVWCAVCLALSANKPVYLLEGCE